MKGAILPLLVAVILCVGGCSSNLLESVSDDSSREADIESARIAIDDGDYQRAADILEPWYDPLAPDHEIARILASAYMGKAGIDFTYVLENSDESDGDSFDTLASALTLDITGRARPGSESGGGRFIVFDSADDMLGDLGKAKEFLDALFRSHVDNHLAPDQDDIIRMGVASAAHFIITVGKAAAELNGCNIPVNKYAYREIFPDDAGLDALLDDFSSLIDDPENDTLASLREDLVQVSAAIDVFDEVLGPDEDIAREFSDFLSKILGGETIENFTGINLAGYIRTELLGYN